MFTLIKSYQIYIVFYIMVVTLCLLLTWITNIRGHPFLWSNNMEKDSNIISLQDHKNEAEKQTDKEEPKMEEIDLIRALRKDFLEADEGEINDCHVRHHNFIQAVAPSGLQKYKNPLAHIKFKPDLTQKVLLIICMLADKQTGRLTYAIPKIAQLYPQSETRQSFANREETMVKNQRKMAYCLAKLDDLQERRYGPYEGLEGKELELCHKRMRQVFIFDYKRSLRDPITQNISHALSELEDKLYIIKVYRKKKTVPGNHWNDDVYKDNDRGILDVFLGIKTDQLLREINKIDA
jgi:hypothetical protein